VRVDVFYTGLEPGRIEADLAAEVRRDVALTLAGGSRYRDDRGVVQLESLVVSTSREMDGAAIAINEQRFAPNLVNVVAADEFGIVPDGNIGEFLKLLPGITMSYRGGDPREVSIDGVSSEIATPVFSPSGVM
jgi:outer membrane receptor for ferrienterochelin and colicin